MKANDRQTDERMTDNRPLHKLTWSKAPGELITECTLSSRDTCPIAVPAAQHVNASNVSVIAQCPVDMLELYQWSICLNSDCFMCITDSTVSSTDACTIAVSVAQNQ